MEKNRKPFQTDPVSSNVRNPYYSELLYFTLSPGMVHKVYRRTNSRGQLDSGRGDDEDD